MLLFYLDEYGNSSLSAPSIIAQPYFVMGAMCIRDTQRWSLFEQIIALKDKFFTDWRGEPWKNSEIKGSYLAQAFRRVERGLAVNWPAGYQALDTKKLRELADELFKIYDKFHPRIYIVGAEKAGLMREFPEIKGSAVGLAYAVLQMHAAKLIQEVYGRSEGGVFIADEQGNDERLFRRGDFLSARHLILQDAEVIPDFRLVLDKPLWVNGDELEVEREICQLIDFAVYTFARAITSGVWKGEWINRLIPYAARHWDTGVVWESGVSLLPKPAHYPDLDNR